VKLSPVDLNLLVALDALIRTESVSQAAGQLGMSKPAMSHALARLRQQLGDPILVRDGQRLTLSNRARELLPNVHGLVVQARRVLSPADVAFELRNLEREFRIAASDHVISLLAVHLGRLMRREAPKAGLRFLPILEDNTPGLREGQEELVIGVFPKIAATFLTQRLFVDRFVCVARRGHPIVRPPLTLETYLQLDHVSIAPRGRPGSPVDDALAVRGLSRHVTRYVPYFLSALDLAASSDCVVTMSERLAAAQQKHFDVQLLKPPMSLNPYAIHQVWHPRSDADPAHHWLRRSVVRVCKLL
jgi:DNA-binding transcriptional LysR family regulator